MITIKSKTSFIKELRTKDSDIYGKPYTKFDEEIDVYRDFVGESLEGFINFMEILNLALKQLEDNFVMSNIVYKARVKDAIGSVQNKGILDDVFGMELITPHEIDKEILMLLMQNIFDPEFCHRDKLFDKPNGYKAYHNVGTLRRSIPELSDEEICSYIFNAKTRKIKEQYRSLKSEERQQIPIRELYEECDMYPALKEYINTHGGLEEHTYRTLRKLWQTIEAYYSQNEELRKRIPAIEVQFKTADISEAATYGNAKHNAYKHIDEDDIIQKYKNRKLMKGMHYPFKFERKDGQMRLQSANQTLIELWPFLKDEIIRHKIESPEVLMSYDMYFAMVFPELKPYVRQLGKTEPYIAVRNQDKDRAWRLLKLKILDPSFTLREYKPSQKGEK